MSLALEHCDDRSSAVKIQALFRGYLLRSRYYYIQFFHGTPHNDGGGNCYSHSGECLIFRNLNEAREKFNTIPTTAYSALELGVGYGEDMDCIDYLDNYDDEH